MFFASFVQWYQPCPLVLRATRPPLTVSEVVCSQSKSDVTVCRKVSSYQVTCANALWTKMVLSTTLKLWATNQSPQTAIGPRMWKKKTSIHLPGSCWFSFMYFFVDARRLHPIFPRVTDLLGYSKLGDSFVTLSVLSVGCPLVCSIPGEFLLF